MEVDRKLSHNPSSYSTKIRFCTDFRGDILTCEFIKDFKADVSLCLTCIFFPRAVCPPTSSHSSPPASRDVYFFWVLSENKRMQCLSDILFTLMYHHRVRTVNIFHMLAKAISPFQHLQDLSTQPFKLALINYFWQKSNKDSSRALFPPSTIGYSFTLTCKIIVGFISTVPLEF